MIIAEVAAQSLEEASPSAALKPLTFSLIVSSAARHIPAGQGATTPAGGRHRPGPRRFSSVDYHRFKSRFTIDAAIGRPFRLAR